MVSRKDGFFQKLASVDNEQVSNDSTHCQYRLGHMPSLDLAFFLLSPFVANLFVTEMSVDSSVSAEHGAPYLRLLLFSQLISEFLVF